MTDVSKIDRWVDSPAGSIFTRTWWPSRESGLAPIILFHDSLGCTDLWRDLPSALSSATGRSVISYDRLGFGRSAARVGRPGLDFIAQEAPGCFTCVREQLDLQRAVLLGHSVGGAMAIHAAKSLGERCEALVTIAAQVFAEERTLAGIRDAREVFKDPAQFDRLAKYHGDKTAWVLDAWIGNWLDPSFESWQAVDVLPEVRSPVLAIHGNRDEYGSTQHAHLIKDRSSGPAQLEILPDVGHVPHREQQDLVLERISRFLRASS